MDLGPTQKIILRIGGLIAGCTLLLTAGFIGIIAIMEGTATDFQPRIPWYLVVAAMIFVATIVLLEINGADGRTILTSGFFTGVLSFVLLFFAFEGILFAIQNPDAVFVSQLILYFFAAALVATGMGYWGLRHWREFTDSSNSL